LLIVGLPVSSSKQRPSPDNLNRARRYVEPNQCFKLIVAFVTYPRVTNVIALEKFRICGRAQRFATFGAGALPDKPFVNPAPRHSNMRCHANSAAA
jgi:hypothetical protein